MKLLYIYLEEDYKHIPKGGYYLDKEFIVEEFTPRGLIKLKKNPNYYNPYNDSIANITCIVGKNGIGKTTFFELLIAPLLWRLDGNMLECKLHLLFYDRDNKEFYFQSYIDDAYNWTLKINNQKKDLRKNIIYQFEDNDKKDKSINYQLSRTGISLYPFQMNIIFHSLSPFDRIYTLVKEKLAYSAPQRKHYKMRFKYIGINQIENNEVKYEYMTIINLLNLFFQNHSKKMINDLGYFFEDITLEIEDNYFEFEDFKYEDLIKNKYFKDFLSEKMCDDLNELFYEYLEVEKIGKRFINSIILKNLKLSSVKRLEVFIRKLKINQNNFLEELEVKLKDLAPYLKYKNLFNNIDFLNNLVKNQTSILKLKKLSIEDELIEIVKSKELNKLLKYVKLLRAKNIISFEINLKKNDNEINFFRLSSGEKTLLSYFANITARIRELIDIKKTDKTYDNLKHKTFIVLIDEVELHLHPEWQRNFIKQLNDFFKYREKFLIKLQFVIATHSPFVVSDMFEDNILYLGDKGNSTSKTFGGNIFDIFKDDFYVSNTIGAFSEEIIKELSEFLYFIFVLKKAEVEDNFFMLRDFFDMMYETKDRDDENLKLMQSFETFLEEDADEEFRNKIEKIVDNKYLKIYREDKDIFFEKSKTIIDKIGEEVIQEHLEKMYQYVRE